jgi:hypothetical protein
MKLAMKLSFIGVLLAAGCAEHTKPDPEFAAEGTIRPHQRMADIQRANGARGDGNLYAAHFTDDALNSLGRAKLDVMMRDVESVRPLTVHMASAPSRDALMRRIESVTAYLKDNGLTEQQMNFMSGPNGESFHPVAPELNNLRKLEAAIPADSAAAGPNGAGMGGVLVK